MQAPCLLAWGGALHSSCPGRHMVEQGRRMSRLHPLSCMHTCMGGLETRGPSTPPPSLLVPLWLVRKRPQVWLCLLAPASCMHACQPDTSPQARPTACSWTRSRSPPSARRGTRRRPSSTRSRSSASLWTTRTRPRSPSTCTSLRECLCPCMHAATRACMHIPVPMHAWGHNAPSQWTRQARACKACKDACARRTRARILGARRGHQRWQAAM